MTPFALRRSTFWIASIVGARVGLGVVVGGLVLGVLIRNVDWQETLAQLFRMSPLAMAAALGFCCLGSYLGAMRWKLLLAEARISPRRLFLVQNTAHGVDAMSPLRIFSVPIQVIMLTQRDRLPWNVVISSLAAKRLLDAFVTCAIVLGGTLFSNTLWPMVALTVPLTVWTVVAWLGVLGTGRFLGHSKSTTAPEAPAFLWPRRRRTWKLQRIVSAVGLTFGSWCALGVAAWFLSHSTGGLLSVWIMVPITIASIVVAGAVPGLPAVFGLFEITFLHFMGLLGQDKSQALAIALSFHAVIIAPGIVMALYSFTKELPSPLSVLSLFHRATRAMQTDAR